LFANTRALTVAQIVVCVAASLRFFTGVPVASLTSIATISQGGGGPTPPTDRDRDRWFRRTTSAEPVLVTPDL